MKKRLLTIAMLLCTSAVFATEVKKADKDGDGTLDKSEVKAFKMLSKNFDIIDADKDGTIDQAEINAHKVLMTDKDGDSTIDKKEIKHKEIAKKFDELDTDKDGTLDAKEIMGFFKKG
jgi:Ca2+-binding EF-hand superfamily protein